jgi:hypothetical protein
MGEQPTTKMQTYMNGKSRIRTCDLSARVVQDHALLRLCAHYELSLKSKMFVLYIVDLVCIYVLAYDIAGKFTTLVKDMTHFRDVSGSNHRRITRILNYVYRGFPQLLQTNTLNWSRPLPGVNILGS